jgi:hypothetical protein
LDCRPKFDSKGTHAFRTPVLPIFKEIPEHRFSILLRNQVAACRQPPIGIRSTWAQSLVVLWNGEICFAFASQKLPEFWDGKMCFASQHLPKLWKRIQRSAAEPLPDRFFTRPKGQQ